MALFVLRAGYSVETTATGGRVVHNRTRDALELSAAEVQILARAAAGGVDAREPGLRPVVKKLATLGILKIAEPVAPATPAAPAEKAAPEAPRLMQPDETVPLLRSDLRLERAERGQVTVLDPLTGRSAMLHEFEVSLARMLNGRRKVADVLVGAQRLGIPASLESLGQFVRLLGGYGFLAPPGAPPGAETPEGTTWEPRKKWDEGSRVLFQTGLRLARRGRRAEASRYFQALSTKDPSNEQARQWLEDLAREESAPTTPADAPPRPEWLESPDAARRAEPGSGAAPEPDSSAAPTQVARELAPASEDASASLDPVLFVQETAPRSADGLAREIPAERSAQVPGGADGTLGLFDPAEPGAPSANATPDEDSGPGEDPSQLFADNELEVSVSEPPDPQARVSSGVEPLLDPIPDIAEATPRPPVQEAPHELAQGEAPRGAAQVAPPAGAAPAEPEGGAPALPASEPSGLMDLMADLPAGAAAADPERAAFDDSLPGSLPIEGLFDVDTGCAKAAAEPPVDASGAVTLPEIPAPAVPAQGDGSAAPTAITWEGTAEPAPPGAGSSSPEAAAPAAWATPPAEEPFSPKGLAAARARSRRRVILGLGAAALALAGAGAWRLGARSAATSPERVGGGHAQVAARPSPVPPAPEGAEAALQSGAASTPEPSPAEKEPAARDKAGAQAAGEEPTAGQAGAPRAEAEKARSEAAEPEPAAARSGGPQGTSPAESPAERQLALGPAANPSEAAEEPAAPGSEPDRRWSPARIVRRGRVTMGEIRASSAGTVSWKVQPQQRIRAGQIVGQLRLDAREASGGSAENVILKAPKAGLLMPAVGDRGRCEAGEKLAAVVYHEAYLIAMAARGEPREDWDCLLSDDGLDQREPCHVVKVAPAAGGWAVTATTAALWIDTARSPRMELAPPPEAAAARERRSQKQ